jgi:NAD-dependent dihydropyrimidine dehydrogenase PreA subunit
VDVCPVDCIVPGKPTEKWPWYYIDPDTCIDCGACIPECPFEAIFEEEGVPSDFAAKGGEVQSMPGGTEGFDQAYAGENQHGDPVKLSATRTLEEGQVVDLTADISANYDYFKDGPGYQALEE